MGQIADWVGALGDAPAQALRMAGLVKALHDHNQLRDLLPSLLQSIGGRLEQAAYAEVLKHLAAKHQQAGQEQQLKILSVICRYATAIDAGDVAFTRGVLGKEGVVLLSASGEWKASRGLAAPNAGLSEYCVLADPLATSLPKLIAACRHDAVGLELHQVAHDPGTWQAMAAELRVLFEPWRGFLPAPDPVGAFLCLLAAPDPVARLAVEFFHTHSRETVNQWFAENHPGLLDSLRANSANPVPVILTDRSSG